MHRSVLLDTSFFLRFLDEESPLFQNSDEYFRYFLQQEITMMISTISIAEYCVGGEINELPLLNMQIIPFNINHAKRTGEFARIVFQNKNKLKLRERNIIPNGTKLFAQADCDESVKFYLSSDIESLKIFNLLKEQVQPRFQFIDLSIPCNQVFGYLDLKT